MVSRWHVLLAALVLAGAASATKVQWSVSGDYVNFPFASASPPFLLRTAEGSEPDRIVVVTNSSTLAGWQLTAYAADSGNVSWTASVAPPDPTNSGLATFTSGLPASQQFGNALGLILMQLGAHVVAVNGSDGRTLWQHPTYNQTTPRITGYRGAGGPPRVYLTSSFTDTSRGVPTLFHYVEALDANTGQLKWANFTPPPPPSGLPTSDTPGAHGVTAVPFGAVYAQGSRLYGLAAADGRRLWETSVSAGAATGLNANVTSVVWVEPSEAVPQRPFPMVLLTTTSWDQTRFMAYQFNTTNGTLGDSPPTVAWQLSGNNNYEGSLTDGLQRLGLQVPQLSVVDGMFVVWSNRTSYDLASGGKPVYNTYLVGRKLRDGGLVWAVNVSSMGWSKTPVSVPVVNLGVAAVVTTEQMVVMDAATSFARYGEEAAPYRPQSTGGQYSYVPITTFANGWGHLAVVRCLGNEEPGTLCVYNGYEKKAPENSAQRRWRPAAAVAQAAAAAAVAAASTLLLL